MTLRDCCMKDKVGRPPMHTRCSAMVKNKTWVIEDIIYFGEQIIRYRLIYQLYYTPDIFCLTKKMLPSVIARYCPFLTKKCQIKDSHYLYNGITLKETQTNKAHSRFRGKDGSCQMAFWWFFLELIWLFFIKHGAPLLCCPGNNILPY